MQKTGYSDEVSSGNQRFYMRLNDDEKAVAAMDVLAPGIGEIIAGSQREERLVFWTSVWMNAIVNKEHYSGM